MTTKNQRARYATVTAGARVFALVVLAPPVAISQEYGAIVNAILLGAIWMCGTFADSIRQIPPMPALVVEASLVTFVACLALDVSPVLLPALVIPPFIGGLVRGTRGVFEVLGAQLAVCVATISASATINVGERVAGPLFTWLMAGVGFGLIAALVQRSRGDESGTTTSYRDARALLTRLLDLSGELVDGLDPVSISQNILDLSREEVPFTGAVVYTRTSFGFTPLLSGDVSDAGVDNTELLTDVFETGLPVTRGPWVAFPLSTDASVVAVVAGAVHPSMRSSGADLKETLSDLTNKLRPEALQLDTALLFSSVRDEATAEERRRLARDLHDGVAQDIASLGYLIDDLTESAESPEQAERCTQLRTELSRVVAELRRSVFVLRNESQLAVTLGESIIALASHIESRSGIAVRVVLDEGSQRLRPDVEGELLRITQEAMNNAVKHARASEITVSCTVHAPHAEIAVTDDGRGLQAGRDDSHGVRIMRERARRIGASLALHNREGRTGAQLTVVLGTPHRSEGPGAPWEGIAS